MQNSSREPAEHNVPDNAELFERIVDSATGFAIFTTDQAGITTSWNTGAERLVGYSAEEMLGRSADLMFTPEDRAAGAPEAERAKARAEGRAEDERWHMHKDGSRWWGSGLMMPLADGSAGFVKFLRDLTERHTAEKQLRESEALFRLLATNIPQLVFRSKATGERSWGSPQWIAFTGLDLDHSLGFGWIDAVHPDDRDLTRTAWDAAQQRGEYYVEHRIRRSADGEYRWHQTRARPTGPAPDDEWVGTSTDIHDMRSLQDRQKVILAELLHRTRNLLAIVQSIARQTARNSSSIEAFENEFGERLGALGRAQGLLVRSEDQPIDLRTLVEGELHAHGAALAEADRMRVEGPSIAVPPGAAQALALAIHELATNAVKHGALGQNTGQLTVQWRVEEGRERRVVLEWQEHGVKVPEEAQKRRGYGRELLERALPYQLRTATRFGFAPDGVYCQISIPVAAQDPRHG